jgi:acetyl-CoA carboxylase carboxyl transferase subunit beta
VIRHGDVSHAAEMAEAQGIGAASLLEAGIVHRVVPEDPEDGPESLAVAVAARVAQELVVLRNRGEGSA